MLVPSVLGYQRYVIVSGSMTGTYDTGSIVFDKPQPVEDLRAGDVITYAPPAGASPMPLVTHRIVAIRTAANGTRVFRTKGDANQSPDPWRFSLTAPTQARVDFSVPYAGRVVSALSDRHTRMLVIGVPAALIALLVAAGMVRDAAGARRRGTAVAPARPWVRL
jgi:signal peptidase